MSDPTPAAQEPGLSLRLDAVWLSGILRADQIRHDTLVSLAVAWGTDGGREDISLQLDALAEAMHAPREGELDHLVTAVEDAAAMDTAETRLGLHTLLRLRAELDAVIGVVGRFNPDAVARPVLLAKVPIQPERGAAA
ncbi:hypothetical protein ABT024_07165 [Streptomyces sp. NPDC002812]|uniref:hypothetical protein n=1 Tax=Streptomyces sp. NPDC002812 TaxID=3154434 RepID=UPI00331CE2BC